jgi:type II secretory pathway pseudopilin PulG
MKKKISLILVLGILIVSLTGCLGSTYPLTDKESDEIAEYVAGVLLKNACSSYKEALATPTPTQAPSVTSVTSTEASDNAGTQTVTQADTEKNTSSQKTSSAQTTVAETATLSEVIGIDGLNVSVDSYSILDSYSNNENGEYVLYPADGDKLLIVKCTLKNTTDKDLDFSISKMFVSFVLKKNGKQCGTLLITAFDSDMQFIKTVLSAGKSIKAELFYEITDKEAKNAGFSLTAERNGKEADSELVK